MEQTFFFTIYENNFLDCNRKKKGLWKLVYPLFS